MRRNVLTAFALAVLLMLTFAAPVGAKAPLIGGMDLDLVLQPCPEGFNTWQGTVTFGEQTYGMAFYNLGTGKPFLEDPNEHVGFFGEIWAIYPAFQGVADCTFLRDNRVMWGTDVGNVSFSSGKYRMNGSVEDATGDFDGWQGRNVHMSGHIDLEAGTAPGTFRAN